MNDIIVLAVQLLVTAGAFVIGKYVFPNMPKTVTEKLNTLSQWAAQFVVWAREFMKTSSGAEKMEKVVDQLKAIADEAGLNVTEDQLKAISQAAYEAMKAGEAEAGTEVATYYKIGQREAAKGSTVNIYTDKVAVATDKVPDEALQQNPDGTYNTYDKDGNKTGEITEEEAEKVASNVTVILNDGKTEE